MPYLVAWTVVHKDTLTNWGLERREAADRIEELEAKLAEAEARINEGENKLALAISELVRLGFDFESIVGRKLKGQTE
jgi:hypothetical protein